MRKLSRHVYPIIAFSLSLCPPILAQAAAPAFQVVTEDAPILTLDRPRSDGGRLIFHRYPDGLLSSVPKTPLTVVQPLSISSDAAGASPRPENETFPLSASERVLVIGRTPGLQPGEIIDIGETGGSSRVHARGRTVNGESGTKYVPRPGEGLPGKALFNPNRDYRPEWDSTLVPGYSMALPNSPDDYVEGKTLPYPPGNGYQRSPGYPPVVIQDGAEPPPVLSRKGGWSPPVVNDSISPPTIADRGSDVPHVADIHEVPRMSYDPSLPPPGQNPSPPKK